MEKIFENAYFGKAYKTRDGRKAVYWCFDGIRHKLITADNKPFQPWCENDGKDYGWNRAKGNSPFDVVSEWQEEINEKELDELATRFYYTDEDAASYDNEIEIVTEAFKAGYRKAMEE